MAASGMMVDEAVEVAEEAGFDNRVHISAEIPFSLAGHKQAAMAGQAPGEAYRCEGLMPCSVVRREFAGHKKRHHVGHSARVSLMECKFRGSEKMGWHGFRRGTLGCAFVMLGLC